jgi:prepilin-type N-terminal cleavage/methylation domain-containing protein
MIEKHPKGFTLVELMVVVAVIGVLAAVSVPTFKKYQLKAISREAILDLSAGYSSLQTLHTDYGRYALCVGLAGFPDSGGYYGVTLLWDNGAMGPPCGSQITGAHGVACPDDSAPTAGVNYFLPTQAVAACPIPVWDTNNVDALAFQVIMPACQFFDFRVRGNVTKNRIGCNGFNGLGGYDTWSINEQKQITRLTPDAF